MFFRRKRSGRTENLQIVKNERVDGKPRQSVIVTLGRVDELAQDGTLDRLLRSGARFAHSAVVLTAYERGKRYILRNTAPSCAGTVLKILGVALPPLNSPRPAATDPACHAKSSAADPVAVVPTLEPCLLIP